MVLSLAASTFGLPSAQYAGFGDIGAPGYGPGIGHGIGHGVIHHKDPCEEGTETIMVKKCHLEPDKSCTSEEVVVGSKVVGHEEPVCEEVEGCADPHEGYGKRSAQFGFGGHPGFGYGGHHEAPCVKHKVCKQGAPIEKDLTKEVETCAVTSKEVCKKSGIGQRNTQTILNFGTYLDNLTAIPNFEFLLQPKTTKLTMNP